MKSTRGATGSVGEAAEAAPQDPSGLDSSRISRYPGGRTGSAFETPRARRSGGHRDALPERDVAGGWSPGFSRLAGRRPAEAGTPTRSPPLLQRTLIRPPEVADDRPADLQRVEAAALAVQHLAAGRDPQRVRQRAGPFLVERVRELVPVLRPHDVVHQGHPLLPPHLQPCI